MDHSKVNSTVNLHATQFRSDKLMHQRTMISAFEDDKSFDVKNVRRHSLNVVSENPTNHKERDKNMIQIYQMLNQYFKVNNINVEEDPGYFEKEDVRTLEECKDVEKQSDRVLLKSKSLKHIKDVPDINQTGIVSNEMVVELFENFQNFLKVQNLPKLGHKNFRSQTSVDLNNKPMIAGDRILIPKKPEMQVIVEDPNEGRYTRQFFSKREEGLEIDEKEFKSDLDIKLKGRMNSDQNDKKS